MDPKECVLYSGGLKGAEAAFGTEAERHLVEEVNFTFDGHKIERSHGVRTLSHAELQQGDVSLEYISKLMNRHFPETDTFKKVLQTIWHQVNNAQEVFVIGKILPDDTVMGGTGWGAEFAKLCNKTLFVFDQERDGWFRWTGIRFELRVPKISQKHFAGTGTRHLAENGRNAIKGLFDRSFA